MGFWRERADSEGQENSPKLISGDNQHLKIIKIVYGKDGVAFTSKSNDSQIMVIYGDDEGREGVEMFTLSAKAAWKLAKMLEAAGLDIDKMDRVGIEPAKFAEPAFTDKQLIGRELNANIIVGRDGWPTFEYLRKRPVEAAAKEQPNLDDIPF